MFAPATDGIAAAAATLFNPNSATYDSSGNLYILDQSESGRLYQVTPGGIIRDLGVLPYPHVNDVFALANGSLILVADQKGIACMYKSPTSCITVAGTLDMIAYDGGSGDGGAATSAKFWSPSSGVGHPTNPNRFWISGEFR